MTCGVHDFAISASRSSAGALVLHEDLALEVHAGRQAEILVIRPRVAVDAAVLAAAIRIDGSRPSARPDCRCSVRMLFDVSRNSSVSRGGRSSPSSIRLADDREPLEAAGGIPGRAAAAFGDEIGHSCSVRLPPEDAGPKGPAYGVAGLRCGQPTVWPAYGVASLRGGRTYLV